MVPFGISGELAQELTRLVAQGGVHVVSDEHLADATLTGKIISARTYGNTTIIGARIQAYDIDAVFDVTLTDSAGKILWHAVVREHDAFLPPTGASPDALGIEANRRAAIHRLAEAAARNIHNRLFVMGGVTLDDDTE